MNANPKAQNSRPHRQVSTMHSWRTLTTSRVRAKPASSIMKPACMKNTRNAVTSTQAVLVALTTSVIGGPSVEDWAPATECRNGAITQTAATARLRPTIFPVRYTTKKRLDSFCLIFSLNRVYTDSPPGIGGDDMSRQGTRGAFRGDKGAITHELLDADADLTSGATRSPPV